MMGNQNAITFCLVNRQLTNWLIVSGVSQPKVYCFSTSVFCVMWAERPESVSLSYSVAVGCVTTNSLRICFRQEYFSGTSFRFDDSGDRQWRLITIITIIGCVIVLTFAELEDNRKWNRNNRITIVPSTRNVLHGMRYHVASDFRFFF